MTSSNQFSNYFRCRQCNRKSLSIKRIYNLGSHSHAWKGLIFIFCRSCGSKFKGRLADYIKIDMDTQNTVLKILPKLQLNDAITIVSGIPRSGTSLIMLILSSLGFTPFTISNIVRSHQNIMNPKGFFESIFTFKGVQSDFEADMIKGSNCLKIFTFNLVKSLEVLVNNSKKIKIIFCLRDPLEIINSRKVNFKLLNPGSDTSITLSILSEWTKLFLLPKYISPENILIMDFNDLMYDPLNSISNLASFVNINITPQQISQISEHCIDCNLYRSKKIPIDSNLSLLLYQVYNIIKQQIIDPSFIPRSIYEFINLASESIITDPGSWLTSGHSS